MCALLVGDQDAGFRIVARRNIMERDVNFSRFAAIFD